MGVASLGSKCREAGNGGARQTRVELGKAGLQKSVLVSYIHELTIISEGRKREIELKRRIEEMKKRVSTGVDWRDTCHVTARGFERG